MIRTMLWMGWTSLRRDRIALMLTFALPIAVFSVFVFIFGSVMTGGGGTSRVELIVVDQDQSEASRRFVRALEDDPGLDVRTAPRKSPNQLYDRETAWALVKRGDVPVAAIIPKGFGETFGSFDPDAKPVELIADKQRDPVAHQMVTGLMQRAAMVGAPDLMVQRGIDQFEKYAGGLTPQQKAAMDQWMPRLREWTATSRPANGAEASNQPGAAPPAQRGFTGMVQVNVVDVQREHKSEWEAFVAYQAAQIAVMFLLFSMAGAAGTLLEEEENGTLERVLTSNLGMTRLLMAKWMFIAIIGMAQLTVMFIFGAVAFGLALWTVPHLIGFAIMSAATAAAGAGFGMVLATACKSRGQLGGVSTIVILVMSAIGGSMLPRFIMSQSLRNIGLATFNAWAIDGYRKVFYDNAPLWQLWPQVIVLAGLTVAFLFIARMLARRWESA